MEMQRVKWATPVKGETPHETMSVQNSAMLRSPMMVEDEKESKSFNNHLHVSRFSVLPHHMTPPSGLTKFIARNPFEPDLTNRLHQSVISPTVFKVSSPQEGKSSDFTWSIDELAVIKPAPIDDSPLQQVHCLDPELETKAQAAITKFFNENQIFPSPWDVKQKESSRKIELETPTRPQEDLNISRESYKNKKDSWSQTVLSLPPELPPELNEALKPYFSFTQDQNTDNEDANSSNNSLRRKLFFNHDDCVDDDEDENHSLSLSPARECCGSPPQSGMLLYHTPLKGFPHKMQRNHGTPMSNFANLSPPNMSPINNSAFDMSCQSVKSQSRSKITVASGRTKLDFTVDMSIDTCTSDERARLIDESDVSHTPTRGYLQLENISESREFDNTELADTMEMPLECRAISKLNNVNKKKQLFENLKLPKESKTDEESYTYQQMNNYLGTTNSEQYNSHSQDTGYQTCSMNNTESTNNITENYSITQVHNKVPWDERNLVDDEEDIRISDWKGNSMAHVCCSTPSKFHKEEKLLV